MFLHPSYRLLQVANLVARWQENKTQKANHTKESPEPAFFPTCLSLCPSIISRGTTVARAAFSRRQKRVAPVMGILLDLIHSSDSLACLCVYESKFTPLHARTTHYYALRTLTQATPARLGGGGGWLPSHNSPFSLFVFDNLTQPETGSYD